MSTERQPCLFSSGCGGSLHIEQEKVSSEALGRSGVRRFIVCDECRQEDNTTTIWQSPETTGIPKARVEELKEHTGALAFSLRRIPDVWKTLVGEEVYNNAKETMDIVHDRLSSNILKDE